MFAIIFWRIYKGGEKMQKRKHVLNLAVGNRKGGVRIEEAADGNIFGYIPDVTAVCTMEVEAEAKINSLCKEKGFFDQSKRFWNYLFPESPYKNLEINLYTTSMLSAMVAILNVCKSLGIKVTLYHFDVKTNSYYPQLVLE